MSVQQDVLWYNRFRLETGPLWVGIDFGLGLARHAGEVDIPVTDGCFGCGHYSGSNLVPQAQIGGAVVLPLGEIATLEGGIRLAVAGVVLPHADGGYNFTPPGLAVRFHLGVGVAF